MPEYMANAEIIASIDVDDAYFEANYLTPINLNACLDTLKNNC